VYSYDGTGVEPIVLAGVRGLLGKGIRSSGSECIHYGAHDIVRVA
jgi:hypothetical protein